jgi:hypothetical protein
MALYSQFMGKAVKVKYRLGDILLGASGTFVADSGRSIFLEQRVELRGKRNFLRWEIPYPYILRIDRADANEENVAGAESTPEAAPKAAAAAAGSSEAISDLSRTAFPPRRSPA